MNLLYLTILFPLVGFFLLAFSRGRWSENFSALVGVGSIGLSALIAVWVAVDFLNYSNDSVIFTQTLWHWITIEKFHIPISLSFDDLSLIMLLVITSVGFLIHLYASWYMRGEEGYSRFFAYTNLFIANMIVLVLADNMLLLYFGWEGVGLCSYLLIGFYYAELKNGIAAMKAFIVTRIGDVMLALALFILYNQLGTLNFHQLTVLAPTILAEHSSIINWATLMLLGGAVGKSAQLPLQTWLADAMAGPTPVSALIHSATMVTAGVYLIARTHELFLMAPNVLYLVGVVGAITLLLASCAALAQKDIKRILAYSTMSQIGYMFLALGVQAWNAALFHLITHAFFKALLFLSSGSIILACHHEQNIFKMGGLRRSMPMIYICFLVGCAALSALPLITAGFYSKDAILWGVLVSGHKMLMLAGLVGVLLTSVYTLRMIFIVFHGNEKIHVNPCHSINHYFPLIVLSVLSTFLSIWIIPSSLSSVLPADSDLNYDNGKLILELTSSVITFIGIGLATNLWLSQNRLMKNVIATSVTGRFFSFCWLHAWGFDWFYDKIFVKPYLIIARLIAHDPISAVMNIPAFLIRRAGYVLVESENGQLRWYATSMGFGAVMIIIILLMFI